MKQLSFFAEKSSIMIEDEVLVIGFLENDDYQNQLTIQYQVTDLTSEDEELGHTKYYISVDSNNSGGYGLVAGIDIFPERLIIELNSEGEKVLGFESIEVRYLSDTFFKLGKMLLEGIFEN